MNNPKKFPELKEIPEKILGKDSNKLTNLYRTTSDYLSEIFLRGLKDRNVLIVDGLKYRLRGNKLIIDKNAAKSADIQGKHYEHVIELPLDRSEVIRRIKLVDKLSEYGIKPENINLDAFERHLSQITWTDELKKKMDLLKGKNYAPFYAHNVVSLDKIDESEVTRRIELVDKLAEYGIKPENINFDAFERHLSQITWTDDLQKKMDLLKGKPYAPFYAHDVVSLDKIDESEIIKRINLATEMVKSGKNPENLNFDAFKRKLFF